MTHAIRRQPFPLPIAAIALLSLAAQAWTQTTQPTQPTTTSQPDANDAARIEITVQIADDLAAGRYESVTEKFDEQMTKALPAEQLKAAYERSGATYGALQSRGRPQTKAPGTVVIPLIFEKEPRQLRVIFSPANEVVGLWLEPEGGVKPPTYRPPNYFRTKRFTEEEVTFGNDPWKISGTLSLPIAPVPQGDASTTGPASVTDRVPAVVFVHGSGPHDRDETIGPNKPLRDIAGGLASRGIAVLRYDKRTRTHGAEMAKRGAISIRDEVTDDARAAISLLLAHPRIDKSRVFLLGHSMGATLAPEIAVEDGRLAGIILLAGSPADPFELLVEQFHYIASLPGPMQEGNKVLSKEVHQTIEKIRAGRLPDTSILLGAPVAYWKELREYTARSIDRLKSFTRPVFIAAGGRDYQVTRRHFNLYGDRLKSRKNVSLHWYPNLNHLFIYGTEMSTPEEYGQPGHVDLRLIRDLAKWIKEAPPLTP